MQRPRVISLLVPLAVGGCFDTHSLAPGAERASPQASDAGTLVPDGDPPPLEDAAARMSSQRRRPRPTDAGVAVRASSRRAGTVAADASMTPPDPQEDGGEDPETPAVECGGYVYPGSTIVDEVSCTGAYSDCVGPLEFRVIGCSDMPFTQSPCPAGFAVATAMLIGQWAEAADITRFYSGDSVCVWAHGSGAGESACGGSWVSYTYCWPRGALCPVLAPGFTASCPESGPCSVEGHLNPPTGYEAPVLCVRAK